MYDVRPVTPADYTAISVLVVSAFGQNNEHRLIETLREAGAIALELVALRDGQIVGHICFSQMDAPQGWWALAPVSVAIAHQGKGVGGELIRCGLDRARQDAASAVVVLGNPSYYRRFGFVFDGASALSTPFPIQYTGLFAIAPEAATAAVALSYPRAFDVV